MIKKYAGLALIAAMAFAQQTSNAIHLKDKEGNFIGYDQEKREITTTKDESKAARFMITPVWGHDKDGLFKRLGKKQKSAPNKKADTQEHRHFKLLLHNKGSSVLFPMGWNGTTLFVPRKSPAEFCPQDGQPKGQGKGMGKGKGTKSNKPGMKQAKSRNWKKFGKMVVCTIEGVKVTPDTTNEQLDEVKVVFTFKEGKKEITKELFFEKGTQEKHHREESKEVTKEATKEAAKEVTKETKEETTKKEEVKEESTK